MGPVESPDLARKLAECYEKYGEKLSKRQEHARSTMENISKQYSRYSKSEGVLNSIRKTTTHVRKKIGEAKTKYDSSSIQTEYRNESTHLCKLYEDWYIIPEPLEIHKQPTLNHVPQALVSEVQ